MSWSFCAAGKPGAVGAALLRAADGYGALTPTNYSRQEIEAARVGIEAFLAMNTGALQIEASGYGTYENGVLTKETCTVKVTPLVGFVE